MRPGAPGALRMIVALACGIAAPAAAQAGDIRITAPADLAAAPPSNSSNADTKPLTPEESALLGNVLMFDPADIASTKSAPALRLPTLSKPQDLSVDTKEKPDGSSKVTVKQPLAGADWEANVGADLNTAAPPQTTFQPGKPFPGTVDDRGSGAAWASFGVPNFASVDARVDPTDDRGQIGTTFKHSIPLGDNMSVTLQDRYSMTGNYAASPSPTPSSSVPPIATQPGDPAAQPPEQVFGTEKSIKFNIASTGTTFGGGVTSTSNDPVTHNSLSADQKLFGPLHVTTRVSDIGQPVTNKSITAGFKLDW